MDREALKNLTVFADEREVVSFGRAVFSGKDSLGLLPSMFILRLHNLSASDVDLLSTAKKISVSYQGSVLAAGDISNVVRRITSGGSVTSVAFSMGLSLWEASVTLSIEANTAVSETVRRILAASGTEIPLLSFPGADPMFLRGQAYFGRAAESVVLALSAASARGYLTASGLCVVPDEDLPVSVYLSDEDLVTAPFYPTGDIMVLRTRLNGWQLGKMVSVAWKGVETKGIVSERAFNADNVLNVWESELLVEVRRS